MTEAIRFGTVKHGARGSNPVVPANSLLTHLISRGLKRNSPPPHLILTLCGEREESRSRLNPLTTLNSRQKIQI
jgi:hypothetical protein